MSRPASVVLSLTASSLCLGGCQPTPDVSAAAKSTVLADDGVAFCAVWNHLVDRKQTGFVLVDDVMYVTSACSRGDCGEAYALDADTGDRLWVWDAGERGLTSPLVADGRVYVYAYTEPNSLHALDAATGEELWSTAPGGATAIADGVLYASGPDGLQALDPASGRVLWYTLDDAGDLSAPAVAGGLVFVHSDEGYLYAVSVAGAEPGRLIWKGATQDASKAPPPPAVAEGRVYVGAGGTLYAFDADGGGSPECDPVWATSTRCELFGALPTVANNVVFTAGRNNHLCAFDASTGEELWHYSGPSRCRGAQRQCWIRSHDPSRPF